MTSRYQILHLGRLSRSLMQLEHRHANTHVNAKRLFALSISRLKLMPHLFLTSHQRRQHDSLNDESQDELQLGSRSSPHAPHAGITLTPRFCVTRVWIGMVQDPVRGVLRHSTDENGCTHAPAYVGAKYRVPARRQLYARPSITHMAFCIGGRGSSSCIGMCRSSLSKHL